MFDSLELVFQSLELMFESLEHRFPQLAKQIHNRSLTNRKVREVSS